jgi:hypothetical protein
MSNIATLLPPMRKGERRRCGRAKGQTNRMTRALKIAVIFAAEKSEHSKDKSLEGYCLYLANEHPTVFAALLGKLIPAQAKVKAEFVRLEKLSLDMPLSEMIRNFELKIKSDYQPAPRLLIEHDDDDEPDA